ncbi:MAG: multidrug DMT transporter permease [Acetobacteraceae bacterium]|nr:multidrug DMT transporter permease [Acetobacteraceae bacterium]
MQTWFVALLLLSAAGVIEARCSTPGLRPPAPAADRAFKIMGRSAFAFWLVLLGWGFLHLPWWQPIGGIIGSLALNALIVQGGARPFWPGISMGLALVGLFLTAVVLTR